MKDQFRAFLAALVDTLTSRVDLAAAELEDLLLRVGKMLAFMLACALAAGFALMFLSFTIVMAVPESFRWLPALILTLIYGGGAAYAGLELRRALREMPPPFSSTRDVLHRDAAALRPAEPEEEPKPADPAAL